MAIPHAGGNGGGGKKGGKKKKPPHDPPGTGGHPHPVHTGHHHGGGAPHDPPGTGGHPHPSSSGSSWAIRRQRLLRAAGYNVSVDGIWGAQSQAAWSAYVSGQRYNRAAAQRKHRQQEMQRRIEQIRRSRIQEFKAHADAARKQARIGLQQHRQELQRTQANRILTAQRRVEVGEQNARLTSRESGGLTRREQRNIIQEELAKQREVAGAKAIRLSGLLAMEQRTKKLGVDGPRNIAGAMSLGNLVDVLFDPYVGTFDPLNDAHVRVTQRFLQAHGKGVEVTGDYDVQTHRALVESFREAAEAERRRQREALVETFYDSGLLRAGMDTPFWLPTALGHVPKPGELLRMLQRDDFTSAILWRAMVEKLAEPQAQWIAFRQDQMDELLRLVDPQNFNLANLNPPSERRARAILWSSPAMNNPEGHARLRALYDATDFKDFERRVRDYTKWEEYQYLWQQKIEAKKSIPWWGHSLQWYDKVGDDLRLWLQTEVEFMVNDPWDYLTNYERDRNKWEREAYNDIQNAPGWLKFAQEVMIDPLMFVPVGKIAGVATRAGLQGLDVAAIAAMRASLRPGLRGTKFAQALALSGAGLEHATFQRFWLPELREATMQRVARGGFGPSALAIHYTATKATRLKNVAIQTGVDQIEWASRHGFRPVKSHLAKLGHGIGYEDYVPRDSELLALRDSTDSALRSELPSIFGRNLQEWGRERVSLWSTVERGKHGLSSFGAALQGAWASRLRVMEVHRMAADYAAKEVDRVLESYGAYHLDDGTLIVPKEGAAKIGVAPNEQARAAEVQALARAAGRKEYQRVVDGVGVYRRGSGEAELLEALEYRVRQLLDRFDNVLMPALQDQLEAMAKAGGVRLFDDAGRWIGQRGVFQERLKKLIEQSFDPENLVPVKNPLWNVRMPFLQAKQHIEAEVKRRQMRWLAWYGREIDSGNPNHLTRDWLDQKLVDEEQNVKGHWQQVEEDGKTLFYDDREFLQESPLYAGHVEATMKVSYDDFADDPNAWQERIMGFGGDTHPGMNLGLPPAMRAEGALDREIGEALWALGSGHRAAPLSISQLDPTTRPGLGRFAPNVGTRSGKEKAEQMDRFRRAVTNRQVFLAAAHREAYPRAMASEWAFWHALSTAQSRPLKVTYKTLQAHLALWQFVTLPLNPAWRVRNVVDNTAKTFIDATKDPRFLFYGAAHPGSRINSVFDHNLRAMRHMVRFFDNVFHTNVEEPFVQAMETFWSMSSEAIGKVFAAHGVEVPEAVVKDMNFARSLYGPDGAPNLRILNADVRDLENTVGIPDKIMDEALRHRRLTPAEEAAEKEARSHYVRFKDWAWDVMGSRPEDAARRRIYRTVFHKEQQAALKAGKSHLEADYLAFAKASKAVERVLFDYSKITTLEDNLRVFFPFIQFWRKNSAFWLRNIATKPWLPLTIAKFEDARQEAHQDWPEWMRRYFHAKELSDFTALVPGLEWLVNKSGLIDTMYDPLNFFSFAPMYRLFKSENEGLPVEKQGWKFIAPMVDAITDAGLGLNPLVRAPLENAGVLNERAWRSVFPQTQMVSAISREFLGDWFADRVIDLDAMFADPLGAAIQASKEFFNKDTSWASERYEQQVEKWVQMEIVNQVARGEEPNREKALRKIRTFFLVQSTVGLFTSAYVRRMTQEDFYLYKLTEDVYVKHVRSYESLTAREKELLKLWGMRKADRLTFDRYLDNLPLIRTYYRLPSYSEKEAFKGQHPEILPFVESTFSARDAFPMSYVQQAHLIQDTSLVMELSDLGRELDLPYETMQLANSVLVTPELKAFWAKNDTPAERRDKMTRSLWFRHVRHLSDTYFAIPENDYDGKSAFLKAHPELEAFWNENNSDADDYKMIIQSTLADLRDRYFEFVDDGDWDGANAFLTKFPFTFDKFRGNKYVQDRETGRTSGRTLSQHAKDYLAAKKWLDFYFQLSPSERSRWLNSGAPGALIVKAYFDKYSSRRGGGRGGMTQHARDYLAARPYLNYYFSLSKSQRGVWLHSGAKGAAVVLNYFKKYGSNNRVGRAFKNSPLLRSRNAELNSRLKFWQHYWQLDPDQRPQFVMRHAEEHGIFVYGVLGARELHDREAQWMRKAFAAGMTERAAHYLYVKPLLDFFFKLKSKDDKALFIRANPELAEYLDNFARKTATGNAKLDRLIEAYFNLPQGSVDRSVFLRKHPEVQHYFDKHSSPAELAMRRLLNVYFELPVGTKREKFLAEHPEIQEYFDQRQRERTNETMQFRAFDQADPRLREFFEFAERDVADEARRQHQRMIAGRYAVEGLASRRERQPADK